MADPDKDVLVRYSLRIEAYLDDQSGDDMRKVNLEDFLAHARKDAQNVRVFLQRGSGPQQEVRARVTVQAVTVLPRSDHG